VDKTDKNNFIAFPSSRTKVTFTGASSVLSLIGTINLQLCSVTYTSASKNKHITLQFAYIQEIIQRRVNTISCAVFHLIKQEKCGNNFKHLEHSGNHTGVLISP